MFVKWIETLYALSEFCIYFFISTWLDQNKSSNNYNKNEFCWNNK